jgi:hypothetical protein
MKAAEGFGAIRKADRAEDRIARFTLRRNLRRNRKSRRITDLARLDFDGWT